MSRRALLNTDQPLKRRQQGFSLLELVLVMVIMGVMASVSLSFLDEQDSTQRARLSNEKIKAIKRHFLSVDRYQGEPLMSGFVVDNGLDFTDSTDLPSLINMEYLFILPQVERNAMDEDDYFRVSIKESYRRIIGEIDEPIPILRRFGFLDEVYVGLDQAAPASKVQVQGAGLFKGLRSGLYDISSLRDSKGAIKDNWGDDFDMPLDTTDNTLGLKVKTAGKAYKTERGNFIALDIKHADTAIPLSQLTVQITGIPTSLLPATFKVALVSFNNFNGCNNNVQDCWQSLYSNEASPVMGEQRLKMQNLADALTPFNDDVQQFKQVTPTPSAADPKKLTEFEFVYENPATSSDENWGFVAADTSNLLLDFAVDPSATPTPAFFDDIVTVGRHLLVVLIKKDTAAAWQIYPGNDLSTGAVTTKPLFRYVELLPGMSPSRIAIEVAN